MDFSLTQSQQMIQQSAREFLEKECPRSLVRTLESEPLGYSPELWQKMAKLGWLGLVFPEEYGGSGGDFLDLALLLEEMGRALVPGPFFSSVVLFGLTLLDASKHEQRLRMLPALCRGELIGTAAVELNTAVTAKRSVKKYTLQGECGLVPYAHVVHEIMVPASLRGVITLFLVPVSSAGVKATLHKSWSGERLCRVQLSGVELDRDAVVGQIGKGEAIVECSLQRVAASACALMVGGMQSVLDMTLAYVKERTAFGRPIGSYQAIQHFCADMATLVDGSKYLTYQAAWRIAHGVKAYREVHMAKAYASKAYQRVCVLAHQCHGAIGFSQEYDLQLYTRRAKALELLYGDSSYHLQGIAEALATRK